VIDLVVGAETLLLCLLGLLVLGLLRSHAEILRRLESLSDPGTLPAPKAVSARPAPPIAGVTPSNEARSYTLQTGGGDTLLAFLSSGCSTCGPLLDALAAGGATVGDVRLIVVAKDPNEERPRRFRAAAARHHVVMSSRAWREYDVPGSPYFIHVDGATGAVAGEGSAPSWDRVADLLAGAREDAADAPSRTTATLQAAGIEEGHPSLHPSRV
jgi:hypothetical protein